MIVVESDVSWFTLQPALAEAVETVADVVAGIPDPDRPAFAQWTVGDVAAHLSHAWLFIPRLAARDLAGGIAALPPTPEVGNGTPGGAAFASLPALAPATVALVRNDPERDPAVLADRIRTAAKAFAELDVTDSTVRPWMIEGVGGPPAHFAAHLLNETVVHGHDISRATGRARPVPDHLAALVLRSFLLPMLCITNAAPFPAPWSVELRLAGESAYRLDAGAEGLRFRAAGGPSPDARLWIRPSAMLLLAWRRRSLASVIMGREALVWGRRPWVATRPLAIVPQV
ncbi:MAG TPA: maleylpyruvate isomerase N-terminal domain-containing protein [Sporichthyaceae bacterium]|nr:maleylpyruvate isomerase N-terminal domain-containing protein [Sporichthyaceae bacterium]